MSTVRALAAREREARADFIVHLAELDRRRLHLAAGFPSLFSWLVDHLRFSRASAYRRVTACRLVQRMPAVAAYLREGRLGLVKLCLLKDLLAPDNHLALLEQAASLTEREVEELAAVLDPRRRPQPRDSIRPLGSAPAGQSPPPPSLDLFAPPVVAGAAVAPPVPGPAPADETPGDDGAPAGSIVEPAPARAPAPPAPARHLIKMTVGPELLALLDELRAELSHTHPAASLEALLAESMKLALAAHRKRSRAQADRSRRAVAPAAPAGPGSRHVPAEVRRHVWERDRGRCTFVADDGRRCDATHRLELHHDVPFARGGPATLANVRLLCRLHNDLVARRDYGDERMDRLTRASRPGSLPPQAEASGCGRDPAASTGDAAPLHSPIRAGGGGRA